MWVSGRWQATEIRIVYRDADQRTYGAIVDIDGVAVLVKEMHWRTDNTHLVVFAPWPTGGSLSPSVHKLAELVDAGLLQVRTLRHANTTVSRHIWIGDPVTVLLLLIPTPATSVWQLPDHGTDIRIPETHDQTSAVKAPRPPAAGRGDPGGKKRP
ncbi:hypothetical protein C5E45_20760 [Nocardia nova]|uniref:Uncharacterized protein n=1 Tax=Nocardia nova TaxID=37330 RepID=A0A2S6AMM7_9NOCA|nr:hypothetical protein [Nocardia nova]PPJ36478.1 hypothetical protein C5E45_20760 [Nocardia nova]